VVVTADDITYEAEIDTDKVLICDCTDRQTLSDSNHAEGVTVIASAVRFAPVFDSLSCALLLCLACLSAGENLSRDTVLIGAIAWRLDYATFKLTPQPRIRSSR
jgi:hypothetical protein